MVKIHLSSTYLPTISPSMEVQIHYSGERQNGSYHIIKVSERIISNFLSLTPGHPSSSSHGHLNTPFLSTPRSCVQSSTWVFSDLHRWLLVLWSSASFTHSASSLGILSVLSQPPRLASPLASSTQCGDGCLAWGKSQSCMGQCEMSLFLLGHLLGPHPIQQLSHILMTAF